MKRARNLVRSFVAGAICVATATSSTTAGAATCSIDGSASEQTIDGFGFSSAWSGALSSAQGDILFGTASGQLGFSLLRIRIDPNRAWSNETNNVTLAHARGAEVLGSPWSPPASMKDNNNVVHGSLLSSQYANYADYLKQAATTIGLDYVSLQNEPDWNPDYEGCTWTPEQLHTFTRDYAQAIGKPVVMPEALGFNDAYSDPTLNDTTAASHVTVVAGHFYGNGNYEHQNAINKGKRVWMTEHYVDGTDIAACMGIAKEVSDAMNNQFNAYFWWWISPGSQTTLIDGTTPRKTGYTLAQFAKYVRPGQVRIGATYNPTSNVYVTAYGTNGLAIVAVNTGSSSVSQTFALQNLSGVTSLTPVRTSANENLAQLSDVSVSNDSFTYTLPAQSITTFTAAAGGGGQTSYTLTVGKAGSGSGTVTGTNINCGSTCSASYASGTSVTLAAIAASGSTFAGWSGACTGTATCTVSMNAARTVTAAFNTSGGTGTTPCSSPITVTGGQSGNFNTTGAVCLRTNATVNGWGCSNFEGRTVSVNGGTATSTCGAGPFPLAKYSDGYAYFSISAGTYSWASLYYW